MAELFAQLEVDFVREPKMRRAGPLARLLYIQAMCWCKENEQNGEVEPWFAQEVAADIPNHKKHFNKLVDVGLMEHMDSGGWKIPLSVWIKRNPTKQDLEAMRRKKSEAGKRGAHSKWHSADNAHEWCDACQQAGYLVERVPPPDFDDGKPMAPAMANAWQDDGKPMARTSDLIPESAKCQSVVRDDLEGSVDKSGPTDPRFSQIIDLATQAVINKHPPKSTDPQRQAKHRTTIAQDITEQHTATISDLLRRFPDSSPITLAQRITEAHG